MGVLIFCHQLPSEQLSFAHPLMRGQCVFNRYNFWNFFGQALTSGNVATMIKEKRSLCIVEFCTPIIKHKHSMALDVGLDFAFGGLDFRLASGLTSVN